MLYPKINNTNSRYRGPAESIKASNDNKTFKEQIKVLKDKLSSYSDNLNKLTQCVNGNDKDTINSSINRIYNIINNTEVI